MIDRIASRTQDALLPGLQALLGSRSAKRQIDKDHSRIWLSYQAMQGAVARSALELADWYVLVDLLVYLLVCQ